MPGTVDMGRKKKQRKGEPEVKRIAIQGTPAWVAWVEEGARHCRTDVSKLIDMALTECLAARGFVKQAPDRLIP